MEAVAQILSDILKTCRPSKVLLVGEKRTMSTQKLKSISLCVIIPEGDTRALRCKLHLAASADVPLTLHVYTADEWAALLEEETSYAAWIARKGQVLYEQT